MKNSSKKLLSLMLAVTLAFVAVITLAFSGCGNNDNNPTGGGQDTTNPVSGKNALVCSSAGANDNGYNQTAINGLKQLADETGVEYKVIETTTDYPGTLKT
ncbi:MAG: BMP family ABC transporter substrate-binding protein, partial [Clostridiales bacterium]|nr:BMP family ABC transporter substrate-binding protein [Clostridiales bacterium]